MWKYNKRYVMMTVLISFLLTGFLSSVQVNAAAFKTADNQAVKEDVPEYPSAVAFTQDTEVKVTATMIAEELYYFLPSFSDPAAFCLTAEDEYEEVDDDDEDEGYSISKEINGTYNTLPADISDFNVDENGAYIVWIKGEETQPFEAHVLYSANVPAVFISSDDPLNYGKEYIESSPDHSLEAKGSMVMIEMSGAIDYDGRLTQIRGRGNSTWAARKKPYQIKLKDKTALIAGTEAKKKWVLLANFGDATLIKDYMAKKTAMAVACSVDFADALSGAPFAAQHRIPVLLVTDGHTSVARELLESCGHVERLRIFGGIGTVSQEAENDLKI